MFLRRIFGFPFAVDPLVFYYNKDILKNEEVVNPPKTWDELFELNKILTKRDNSGILSQNMIALGQYGNIKNAKEIISNLLIQNGISVVSKENTKVQDNAKNLTKYFSTLENNNSNMIVQLFQFCS